MESKQISQRIRDELKKKKITQNTLYADLGLNKNFLFHIDQGSFPSVEAISKVADYFGCTVDYLIGQEPSAETEKDILMKKIHGLNDTQFDILINLAKAAGIIGKDEPNGD